MIRHARMRGHAALFLPGLDHASIAAQFVLDGILAKEGESRQTLGRERYLERMRAFSDSTRPVMLGQQRRVGASADWGRLRYTMDEGSARAVRVAFDRLYRDGLAYRTEALVNWCPGLPDERVSDLEVIPTPETGTLWSVRYHLVDEATGEPDPTGRDDHRRHDAARDDPRRHRRGRPSRRRALPRPRRAPRADPVRRARRADHRRRRRRARFGTGAVKITPAHDHDDHATGLRHGLPAPTILADDATVTEHRDAVRRARPLRGAPTDRGRPRRARRPRRRAAARDGHRALPAQRRRRRAAPQDPVVHPDRAAGRRGPSRRPARGRTRILPERFEKTWEHWLTNIRDWNVSRQLWWGHRIPAWYCPDGHVTVSAEPAGPAACEACGRPAAELAAGPGHLRHLVQLAGCGRSRRSAGRTTRPTSQRYYPTSVMETGYDIIFFWVARMMMLGLHLTDERAVPHGLPVRPDPRPATARRCRRRRATSSTRSGSSTRPAPTRCGSRSSTARRPATTSASARPSSRTPATSPTSCGTRRASCSARGRRRSPPDAERRLPDERHLGPAERWILSRAAATVAAVDAAMADYAFGEVTRAPVRRDLERVLRLGPRAGQGPPGRRVAARRRRARRPGGRSSRRSTRTCACSTRSCRSSPRRCGRAPASRRRPGAARSSPAGPAPGERDARRRGARSRRSSSSSAASATRAPRRSIEPATWLPRDVVVPPALGPTFEALRPAHRAARPGAAAATAA